MSCYLPAYLCLCYTLYTIQLRRFQLNLDVCPPPRHCQQILFCASYLALQLSCSRSCQPSVLQGHSLTVASINPSYSRFSQLKKIRRVLTQLWWRQSIIFLVNTVSHSTIVGMTTSFHHDAIDQFRPHCRNATTSIAGPRPSLSYLQPPRRSFSVPWGVSGHCRELIGSMIKPAHLASKSSVFASLCLPGCRMPCHGLGCARSGSTQGTGRWCLGRSVPASGRRAPGHPGSSLSETGA